MRSALALRLALFQSVESDHPLKGEAQLVGVQDVKDGDLVPLKTQVRQPLEQRLHVGEAVGDQEHQAAPAYLLGQFVQQRADKGLVLGPRVFQGVEDGLHLARLAAGR